MNKSVRLTIIVISVFLSMTFVSYADTTILTTTVPNQYNLLLEIEGNGTVFVNDQAYNKSSVISFPKNTRIIISQKPYTGYKLQKVFLGDKNITEYLIKGKFQLLSLEKSIPLRVFFIKDAEDKNNSIQTIDTGHLLLWIVILIACTTIITDILKRKKESVR